MLMHPYIKHNKPSCENNFNITDFDDIGVECTFDFTLLSNRNFKFVHVLVSIC